MRFRLIDQITELQENQRIIAIKRLRSDEEYLKDHFPRFPVMPGVLMLEALFQASMWLVLKSTDFVEAIVRLKEVRNVKFAEFVKPGQELIIQCEIQKDDGRLTTLMAQGTVGGNPAVGGRLILERFNAADRYPSRGMLDAYTQQQLRAEFAQLLSTPTIVGAP